MSKSLSRKIRKGAKNARRPIHMELRVLKELQEKEWTYARHLEIIDIQRKDLGMPDGKCSID